MVGYNFLAKIPISTEMRKNSKAKKKKENTSNTIKN